MEVILRYFWVWLCLTNAPKLLESKYQAGFVAGQNPQTFMIPIYSTTKLSPQNQLDIYFLTLWVYWLAQKYLHINPKPFH